MTVIITLFIIAEHQKQPKCLLIGEAQLKHVGISMDLTHVFAFLSPDTMQLSALSQEKSQRYNFERHKPQRTGEKRVMEERCQIFWKPDVTKEMVLNLGHSPPVNFQHCLETFLVVTAGDGGTILQWTEPRDAVEHPAMYKTTLNNTE